MLCHRISEEFHIFYYKNLPFDIAPPTCKTYKKLRHQKIRFCQDLNVLVTTFFCFYSKCFKTATTLKNNLSAAIFKSYLLSNPRVPAKQKRRHLIVFYYPHVFSGLCKTIRLDLTLPNLIKYLLDSLNFKTVFLIDSYKKLV